MSCRSCNRHFPALGIISCDDRKSSALAVLIVHIFIITSSMVHQ